MKRKTNLSLKPVRSPNVPATSSMLYEMEERLSHKIDGGLIAIRGEMASMQAGLRSEISAVKSELKSEISSVKSEIVDLKVDVSAIKSELHRVALLVEEQNARNKFVLDGYAQLYELIERKLG